MSPADTARGACSRHRGMPVLSRCVSCGANLCSQCIVRTPVGFKCAACTGGTQEPAPGPGRTTKTGRTERSGRIARPRTEGRLSDGDDRPRRWGAAAVAVVAVLGAVALTAFLLSRSGSSTVQTVTPTTASSGPSGPASVDVPVQFAGADGHQLSGDLLVPARLTHAVPGVVIVPDWGAVNRNGFTPAGSLPDPLYSDLANLLASHGIASLRYDPAGQGQSTIPEASTLKFADLVGDANAAVALLAQRFDVDPHQITVVGDGWGGLVALQLAAQSTSQGTSQTTSKSTSQSAVASRLVLLSTPGRPAVDSLADELQATAISPADAQLEVTQLQQAVTTLLAGGALPDPATLETPLRPILQNAQAGFLRSVFGLDPTALARQVHIPTLVVRGGADPGINAMDSQLLLAALGPTSQGYVAAGANATLTVTTRTVVTTLPVPTTTIPGAATTTTLGRQQSSVIVTVSRDTQALSAVAQWAAGNPPSSASTTTATSGG